MKLKFQFETGHLAHVVAVCVTVVLLVIIIADKL